MNTSTIITFKWLLSSIASSTAHQGENAIMIADQLRMIDAHVKQLASSTQDVFLLLNIGGLQSRDFLTAFVGFAGVLVGAVIAALANQRLQRSSIAMRRKEELFRPLYEELKQLKDVLGAGPGALCFDWGNQDAIPRFRDWENGKEAVFRLWSQFKFTGRHTELPKHLRDALDDIEARIKYYSEKYALLENEIKPIQTPDPSVIALYQKDLFNKDTVFNFFGVPRLLDSTSEEDLVGAMEQIFVRSQEKDALLVATRVAVSKALTLPSLLDTREAFRSLNKAIAEVVVTLETLIQAVVDEYEYGNDLQ